MPIHWTIYIVEESQLVLPSGSLRAKYAQATFRMVSVGRNFLERYILLTQRPADVSTKALSRVGQLFIGQHFEMNDINKIAHLLGYEFKECREILSSLQLGEFIYFNPYNRIRQKIQTPLYVNHRKPVDYFTINQPKKRLGFWGKFFGRK